MRALRVVVVLVAVAAVILASLWTFQRRLIYFPDTSRVPPANTVIPGARDVMLQTEDDLELRAWLVPPTARPRELAVLVAPGNGGHRAGRTELAVALGRRGFTVLLMDYRGYGGNPGSPSEEGLARDADAAVRILSELGFPPSRTIYFGESLGAGVVAALAARRPPAGLVLRSPFTRLADVGAHHYPWLPVGWLLRDRFPVLEHVSDSRVPLVVVYGDRDSVVPTQLSRRVAEEASSLVEEVIIPGADHNDPVLFGPRVADVVVRLAEWLDRGR